MVSPSLSEDEFMEIIGKIHSKLISILPLKYNTQDYFALQHESLRDLLYYSESFTEYLQYFTTEEIDESEGDSDLQLTRPLDEHEQDLLRIFYQIKPLFCKDTDSNPFTAIEIELVYYIFSYFN